MKIKKVKDFFGNVFFTKFLVKVIFVFNLSILLLYLFNVSFLVIDNTTILLMLLVLVTPFASHIKKIKWGDFEAELLQKDIENLEDQAKEIEEVTPAEETGAKLDSLAEELYSLAGKDRVLAFAKLRIEIERRLKRLSSKQNNLYGVGRMARVLRKTGKLDGKLHSLILDITPILNRVIHGEDVPTEAAVDSVLDIGLRVISALDKIIYEKIIEPREKKEISKEKLKDYMNAEYEVTSVVPLVKTPYLNKRTLSPDQLKQLLEGYENYAEFLVEVKKRGDNNE
jgi:hypothetical protein